jgi:Bacteriophage Gp15 protein.
LKAFNIDIIDQKEVLSWNKFRALLKDVNEDSMLNRVIEIREMPLPPATKKNMERRAEIRRAKKKYDLPHLKKARKEKERETLRKMAEMQKKAEENGNT